MCIYVERESITLFFYLFFPLFSSHHNSFLLSAVVLYRFFLFTSSLTLFFYSCSLISSSSCTLLPHIFLHLLLFFLLLFFFCQANPSDLSDDTNPLFMAEFFSNLKILSQNLFKATVSNIGMKNNNNTFSNINYDNKNDNDFQNDNILNQNHYQNHVNFSQNLIMSPDKVPSSRPQSMSLSGPNSPAPRSVRRRSGSKGAGSFEGFVQMGPLSSIMIPLKKRESSFSISKDQQKEREKEKEREKDYFSSESIHERLRVYAKEGGVPLDYVDRYSQHMMRKNVFVPASSSEEI